MVRLMHACKLQPPEDVVRVVRFECSRQRLFEFMDSPGHLPAELFVGFHELIA